MSFALSLVQSNGVKLNKEYKLVDGAVKKSSIANMTSGQVHVIECADMNQLSSTLQILQPNQAIVLGVPINGLHAANLTLKGNENIYNMTISKTNDYFTFPKEGLCLIDYDPKGVPENLRVQSYGELYALIVKLVPECKDIEVFIKPSSSSGIILPNGEPYSTQKSYHAYFRISNASKERISNLIDSIHKNAIKNGCYYLNIHKNGASTLATPIDESVIKSLQSRLVFEANPTLFDGITKEHDSGIIYNGNAKGSVDLSKMQWDKNIAIMWKKLLEEERLKNASEIARIKQEYIATKTNELKEKGISYEQINKIISTNIEKGMVNCLEEIVLVNNTKITIRDALFIGDGFYMADPLEVQKGLSKALFNRKNVFDAEIYSFLDGGKTYKIEFDAKDVVAVIQNPNFTETFFTLKAQKELESLAIEKEFSVEELALIETELIAKHIKVDGFSVKVLYGIIEKKASEKMADYAILKSNGDVSIIDTKSNKLETYSKADIGIFVANKYFYAINPKSKKLERFEPLDIWLKSERRREYLKIEFIANEPSKFVYEIFKGFPFSPKYTQDITPFFNFVYEVIAGKDIEDFWIILTFFAQILQQPHIKHNTALVLLAGKGVGKSTFVKTMGKLFGDYFLTTSDSEKLLGRFNDHVSSTLAAYANESFFVGDRKNEGKLKSFISESETTYEIKGGAIYSGKNLARLIIDSNDDHVINETADERRFIYANISEEHKGDEAYFIRLHDNINSEGFYESLMYYLLFLDIKPYERYLKFPKRNKIAMEQQLQNLKDIESWWLACLQEGEILEATYVVDNGALKISNNELFNSFSKFTKAKGKRVYESKENFGKNLKKHVIKDSLIIKDSIKDSYNKNAKLYAPLDKCQAYFIKKQNLEDFVFEQTQWKQSSPSLPIGAFK